MALREIENHLERADARIERFEKLEAINEKHQIFEKRFKLVVGIAAGLCALFAIYQQF